MATLKLKVLPKFPAQVLGGDGITITQSGGTYTITVDTNFLSDTYAVIEGGNAFIDPQTITTNSNVGGLSVLSGAAGNNSNIVVGRTGTDIQLGVAGFADQFFTGTVQADTALRGVSGTFFFGVGSNIGLKIGASGAITLPQHVSGTLITNASGVVTANTETGTGNSVRATSPTLTTPNIGAATATTVNGLTITSSTGTLTLTNVTFTVNNTLTLAGTNGKTLTISKTLTLDGTDGTTMTFPSVSASIPGLAVANTFTAIQVVNLGGSNAAGMTVLSGGAANNSTVVVGRTGTDAQIGVAGASDQFFTGTVQTDVALRSAAGIIHIGVGSNVGIKVAAAGTLTFPQHVSGMLAVNGSGVVSATTNTGSGNNVLATSPTITTPNIVGTTAADSASAGSVGQVIESSIASGSAVSLTTGTAANITSISLTAGDWDVWGNVVTTMNGSTQPTSLIGSISTTSATHATAPNGGGYAALGAIGGVGQNFSVPVGMTRINVSSTTTVYLVMTVAFTVSTCSGYGYIGARRRR